MKNIVVLTGLYTPQASPVSNISENIVKELLKKGYRIDVITRKDNLNALELEVINNKYKIHRYNDWNQIIHNKCVIKIKEGKKIYNVILYIKRILFYLPKIFRMQNYSKIYAKKIYKKILNINSEKVIDVIIPISGLHEEIFAALKFKERFKNVKILPYQLDKFADGERLYATDFLKERKYNNNIKLEKKVVESSEKVFVLPPIYDHYSNNKQFSLCMNKIEKTEHPLIQNYKSSNINITKKNNIEILYAGSFYKNLRNPLYLFKLLESNIIYNSRISVTLYSFGDCQDIISKYKNRLNGVLKSYGKISHEKIINKMQNSDILLSIGNNSKNELPSKIFEYLSFCKPIVHFYYSDEDAYLKYLDDYKYAICLKMDENIIEENAKLFYDFCIKYSNVDINYEYVQSMFRECTPKYVVKKFVNQIEG